MEKRRLRILLVDDDPDDYVITRDLLEEIEGWSFELDWASTYQEGLEVANREAHDVYLFDYQLGECSGLELLRQVVAQDCKAPIIMLTGLGDHDVDIKAMQAGASDFLVKAQIDSRLLERSIRYSIRHKRMLEALRESEERYRLLFNSGYDAIFVHALTSEGYPGKFIEVNNNACVRLGYTRDELLNMSPVDIMVSKDVAMIPDMIQRLWTEKHAVFERVYVTKEGTRIPVELGAHLFDLGGQPAVLSIARDIAERKRMEAELKKNTEHLEQLVSEKVRELEFERVKTIHTARLAALGEMATGVAHELNQPLTAMLFDADYIKSVTQRVKDNQTSMTEALVEELFQVGESIAEDIARCRRIVDHLRTFGRVSDGSATALDLNKPIKDCFILIGERLRQRGIELELQLTPNLPFVFADSNRLEQVFLNLVSNAEYALQKMEERVRAGDVEHSGYRKTLQVVTKSEDECVVAIVRDNGCGMASADQERIFEPFFTTKPVGEGTGLGLPISYGIVTEFNGEITFESTKDKGTTFFLRFPILDEDKGEP